MSQHARKAPRPPLRRRLGLLAVLLTLLMALIAACSPNANAPELVFEDRSGDVRALDGSVVSGTIDLRVEPADWAESADVVLNPASSEEEFVATLDGAPISLRFDTRTVEDGRHRLRVIGKRGDGPEAREPVLDADFEIDNSGRSAGDDGASCLDGGEADVVLRGERDEYFSSRELPDGARIDAHGASFLAAYDAADDDPVTVRHVDDLCWSGGFIDNQIPDDIDDWDVYHDNHGARFGGTPGVIVERLAIHRTGDAIRMEPGSDDFTIRDVYVQHAGDDFLENDYLYGGRLEDNLIDWVYFFYSSRLASYDKGKYDGSHRTVVMDGNLVALRPQNANYSGSSTPSYIGFFKMDPDGVDPNLVLRNNIFMAEPHPGKPQVDLTAGGKVIEAENNVIVWLDEDPFPYDVPEGWTLTRDVRVWEEARADWFDRHPYIDDPRAD